MDMPTFLIHYGFELATWEAGAWIEDWHQRFPVDWIPVALLEALYQGRYKAASVEQLLLMWRRRGQPRVSFTAEFSARIWPDQQAQITLLHQRDATVPSPRSHPFTADPCPISTQALLHQLQPLSPKLLRLIHPENSGMSSSTPDLPQG